MEFLRKNGMQICVYHFFLVILQRKRVAATHYSLKHKE